jgi:hypothetical protein
MVSFSRLLAAQAALIALAVLAAIIGGLAAGSWAWAVGCGILAYAAGGAVIMAWMAWIFRSREWTGSDRSWPGGH